MDFGELEMVMERFLWQSYPQHLQNTLFHAEKLAPHRKKPLRARLDQAFAFKAAADELVERANYRDALVQYEMAYGCFKFCEKQDRKIVVRDDAKTFRELRHERGPGEVDGPTRLWAEVDELLCSCLTMIAACNINAKFGGTYENAEKAASEALEVRPGHAPALYRRSEAHRRQDNDGDAVADARSALRAATRRAAAAANGGGPSQPPSDEVIRVRLERHLAHCEAQREVNSWWWASSAPPATPPPFRSAPSAAGRGSGAARRHRRRVRRRRLGGLRRRGGGRRRRRDAGGGCGGGGGRPVALRDHF